MAVRKFKKSSDGTYMWESMSYSVKRRPTQDWCAFYTPLGRMVTKAVGRRPTGMSEEEFCASKTPFKNMVTRKYR